MKPSDIKAGEYAQSYKPYINLVPDTDIISALLQTQEKTVSFFKSLPQDKLTYQYAPGKWTPKEVYQHLIDTERIFAYRALRFARKDSTEIPGFEQDDYIVPSHANKRSMDSLVEEYNAVRQASISLFKNFDEEMWSQIGTASNHKMSARAAAVLLPGHELHHVQVIKDRYL